MKVFVFGLGLMVWCSGRFFMQEDVAVLRLAGGLFSLGAWCMRHDGLMGFLWWDVLLVSFFFAALLCFGLFLRFCVGLHGVSSSFLVRKKKGRGGVVMVRDGW